jgi:hypothetical protein
MGGCGSVSRTGEASSSTPVVFWRAFWHKCAARRRGGGSRSSGRELPPLCRDPFLLNRIEDLTHAEIGARLGVPVRTINRYMAWGGHGEKEARLSLTSLKPNGGVRRYRIEPRRAR